MSREKIQKFIWNKCNKECIRISGTYKKKHLCQTKNVQNNCIKLAGFGVDITRVFWHREISRNILCREKFFNPKVRSQVFRTNPTYFFHYFRLNKTGNKVFSE